MKKLLAAGIAMLACAGPAAAATLDLDFAYQVTFSDPSVAAIGLPEGASFSGNAVFDSSLIQPDQTVTLGGAGTSLTINFGAFVFGAADDIFDAPVLTLANSGVAGLLFDLDPPLVLPTGAYNVSFFGGDAVVTPEGNTVDFRLQASLLPAPGTLAIMLPGIALLAFRRMRRSSP